MCGHWKLDPCVDWTPVNHSYIDSLIESGPFNCGLDWPPWEPHLTPAIMNSPPGLAHGFPSFLMWHDIAAALTVRNATSQSSNMTHHVWIGSYPYGGFQGYPFLDTSGFAIGNTWQRASSQDLVHWENHGNSVGRLTGFAIQDPASGKICAAQRGGCEFWSTPAGCQANGSNNARNWAENTPIQWACAEPDRLDGATAWYYGGRDGTPNSTFIFRRPYHTADGDGQGWLDVDGRWSIAIADDGCKRGDPVPPPMGPGDDCVPGGGLSLWRSPVFGLNPGHDWQLVGQLATVNTSILDRIADGRHCLYVCMYVCM